MQDLITKLVLKQLMKEIIKRVPFLGWGPIAPIVTFFMEKIIAILVEKTALGLNFLYIDIRTERQLNEYNKRMDEIERALMKGDMDDEKIDQMVIDAARDFYMLKQLRG